MKFLKRLNRRADHFDCVPVDDDEDDDRSARGGYLIRAEPGTPTVTLTERARPAPGILMARAAVVPPTAVP